MTGVRHAAACLALFLSLSDPRVHAQVTAAVPPDRAERVAALLDQLRQPTSTFDKPSIARYLHIRDPITAQVLAEIDAFVIEQFVPGRTDDDQVKAGIDRLLHNRPRSTEATSAFLVNLSAGRYLVVGIDIPRIGDGPDDAMWLRAYRDEGGQFARAAAAEFAQDREPGPGNQGALMSLQVTALAPVSTNDFWFVGTARRIQGDRNTVALRIGRFDGETFTATASAPDIFPSMSPTVRPLADGGFTVHRRVARDGKQIIERYTMTPQGPIKVEERDEDSR